MSEIRKRLLRRFRERDYRHAYVDSFLNSLISTQIRIIREREGLSQEELAAKVGTTQSGISRIESPEYSSWRIETLRKVARALDMALSVKFVSFGDAVDDIEGFRSNKLIRPAFEDDPVFLGDLGKLPEPTVVVDYASFQDASRRRFEAKGRAEGSTDNVGAMQG